MSLQITFLAKEALTSDREGHLPSNVNLITED